MAHVLYMLDNYGLQTQTTNTLIIFNNAFPRQQWLRKRASMLRYTYIVCRFAYFKATQKVYFYIVLIIIYFITTSVYYCINVLYLLFIIDSRCQWPLAC
jgi:hypothetical protein